LGGGPGELEPGDSIATTKGPVEERVGPSMQEAKETASTLPDAAAAPGGGSPDPETPVSPPLSTPCPACSPVCPICSAARLVGESISAVWPPPGGEQGCSERGTCWTTWERERQTADCKAFLFDSVLP